MEPINRRLFVGIKITPALEKELNRCPSAAEHYFKENRPESLEIVALGAERLIGRFLEDGFPVNRIDNVNRNVRSIVTLITQGYRLPEDAVRVYVDPEAFQAVTV